MNILLLVFALVFVNYYYFICRRPLNSLKIIFKARGGLLKTFYGTLFVDKYKFMSWNEFRNIPLFFCFVAFSNRFSGFLNKASSLPTSNNGVKSILTKSLKNRILRSYKLVPFCWLEEEAEWKMIVVFTETYTYLWMNTILLGMERTCARYADMLVACLILKGTIPCFFHAIFQHLSF